MTFQSCGNRMSVFQLFISVGLFSSAEVILGSRSDSFIFHLLLQKHCASSSTYSVFITPQSIVPGLGHVLIPSGHVLPVSCCHETPNNTYEANNLVAERYGPPGFEANQKLGGKAGPPSQLAASLSVRQGHDSLQLWKTFLSTYHFRLIMLSMNIHNPLSCSLHKSSSTREWCALRLIPFSHYSMNGSRWPLILLASCGILFARISQYTLSKCVGLCSRCSRVMFSDPYPCQIITYFLSCRVYTWHIIHIHGYSHVLLQKNDSAIRCVLPVFNSFLLLQHLLELSSSLHRSAWFFGHFCLSAWLHETVDGKYVWYAVFVYNYDTRLEAEYSLWYRLLSMQFTVLDFAISPASCYAVDASWKRPTNT